MGTLQPDSNKDSWEIVSDYIEKGIAEGVMSISINCGFSAIHAITLWGYELTSEGLVGKIYVTDSDDLLHTPSAERVPVLHEYSIGRRGEEIGLLNSYIAFSAISQLCTLKEYSQ